MNAISKPIKIRLFVICAVGLLASSQADKVLSALAVPPIAGDSITLKSYDGTTVPKNKEGVEYPVWSDGRGGEGGVFSGSIDVTDSVSGNSFKAHLVATAGSINMFYAQFNPYDGVGREFARTYADDPTTWRFNTYNRWSYWIKPPAELDRPYATDGQGNANIGAYAKTVTNANYYSDEDGGGHFYYNQNWPLTGTWVQCTMNFYPDHWRGNSGGDEPGSAERITGESNYNLFDALTRFYFQANNPPASLPADYRIDEIKFYREVNAEPEQQVRDVCSTYLPSANRVIVTWMRNKNENDVKHEVRYAFSDIHTLGWSNATPAPDGVVTPPGYQGYNGMFYDTGSINVAGRSVLYLAIKPQNTNLFAQVAVPLSAASRLPAPMNLRVVSRP